MTDSWRSRISRDLADVQGAQTRQSELDQIAQEEKLQADREADAGKLKPGDLVSGMSEGREDTPEFADSLIQRLKQDAAMPFLDAGGSALYSLNLLVDPLQEKNLLAGEVVLGTSWTEVGTHWEARKVLESGADPVVTVKRTYQRTVMEGQIYRTNVMVFDVAYAAAGAATIEYRPKVQALEPVHIDWPWATTAFRAYIDTVLRPATNLLDPFPDDYAEDDEANPPDSANYIRAAMVDGDVWVEPATYLGDEHELQKLSDDKQEAQAYVGSDDTIGKKHWPFLQMHVETTADGGVAIGVAEPQFNYSYQESPMPYEPDIGNFDRTQDDIVPGYPGDNARPSDVTGVIVAATYREHTDGTSQPIFSVTWDPVPELDVMGYEIQWAVAPLDEQSVPIPPDWSTYQTLRVGPESVVAGLDPIIGNEVYHVRVRAYDSERMFSLNWSVEVAATALPDESAPDIPTGVIATGGYQLMGVTWEASSAPDLSFYQLRYRAVEVPELNWGDPIDVKSNRYIIDGLADEVLYEAEVRAIDRSGNVRVSGNPQGDPPDEVIGNYQDSKDAGWSVPADPPNELAHQALTVLVGAESVAFIEVVARFIDTGVIEADQIHGGELIMGMDGQDGTIRMYTAAGVPIGAWGKFGWIIVNPNNNNQAVYGGYQGQLTTFGMFFTNEYSWDGNETRVTDTDRDSETYQQVTVTNGVESGIDTTTWTTAIGPLGINAEAIRFGSAFGGNNRLLNAGFELLDFDVATLVEDIKTDAADFALGRLTGLDVNLNVAGTEIRMTSVS